MSRKNLLMKIINVCSLVVFFFIFNNKLYSKNYSDTIYYNGTIATMEKEGESIYAFGVKDGKINLIFPQKKDLKNEFIGKNTQMVDLKGRFIMPGIIDTHAHMTKAANVSDDLNINLSSVKNVSEYLDIIKKYVEKNSNATQYVGYGWSNTVFQNNNLSPLKEQLDSIVKDKLLLLRSEDGHSIWVNSYTLKKANITKNTSSPQGGEIVKDKFGNPTGLLNEWEAIEMVSPLFQDYTLTDYKKAILQFQEKALALGMTSILDPYLERKQVTSLKELIKENNLKIRVGGAYSQTYNENINKIAEEIKNDQIENKFFPDSIKIFVDGVVEAKTALLKQPYEKAAGMPEGYKGIAIHSKDELEKMVSLMNSLGIRAHIHAIGDEAVSMALDAIEYSKNQNLDLKIRNSITHLQLVDLKDFPRFKDLNVNAIVPPIWVEKGEYFNSVEVPYLGLERAEKEYPIKSFLDNGVNVSQHTDYPVTPLISPFIGIQKGVTRKGIAIGKENLVCGEKEKVSLFEILKIYTINGAVTMNTDKKIGTISVGKFADFIVVDKNPYKISSDSLNTIVVEETYINGEQVYKKK